MESNNRCEDFDVCLSSFFRRDILSAILFATVLIHWELMPSGEFISRDQKKRARQQPILDFRQAPVFQLRADVLLVTLRRTGCGSFVRFVVVITWREAQ